MSGLKFGQKYLYRVSAENAAGVSDPAETLGPLMADDPHGETCTIYETSSCVLGNWHGNLSNTFL